MRNSLLPAFQKQRSRFIELGAFPSPSRISLSLSLAYVSLFLDVQDAAGGPDGVVFFSYSSTFRG